MSALLESIALSYAKSKGLSYITDEAREYAAKKLGIDTKNPKYAISIGNMKIDPMRIIANQGIKSIMKGGSGSGIFAKGLPLIAAGLGLGYLTNPLREGSYNYNPELQGQIDYASGKGYIDRNNSMNALQYNKNSILSGQNVVSGFGTNDYGKQLQKYIDKMEARKTKGYNTIGIGPFKAKTTGFTDFQQSQLDKAKTELEALTTNDFDEVDEFMSAPTPTQTGPTYKGMSSVGSGGNGSGSGSSKSSSSGSSSSKSSSSGSSRHGSGPGGLHSNYRRGGIASL